MVPEIDRKIIELMDSSWIVDLYEQPEQVTADQQEDQAIETTVMNDGFVPKAAVNDDHIVHCTMIEQFIQFRRGGSPQPGQPPASPQPPIPPDFMGRLMEHGMMHVQMARGDAQYMKQNYQAISQFQQKFQATLNQLQKQSQMQSQAAGAMNQLKTPPGRGTMPGGPPPGGVPPMVPPPPTPGAAPVGAGAPPNPQNNGGPQ